MGIVRISWQVVDIRGTNFQLFDAPKHPQRLQSFLDVVIPRNKRWTSSVCERADKASSSWGNIHLDQSRSTIADGSTEVDERWVRALFTSILSIKLALWIFFCRCGLNKCRSGSKTNKSHCSFLKKLTLIVDQSNVNFGQFSQLDLFVSSHWQHLIVRFSP